MTQNLTNVQRVTKLYKTILRLHRGLPNELRVLGDSYVHDEFKRHKTCTQQEANVFMDEWVHYAITLAKQLGAEGPGTQAKILGENLPENKLHNLRDEQIQQLYELMVAAKAEKDS